MLDGYDWDHVLDYARKPDTVGVCDNSPITRESIQAVICSDEGDNDGPNWIAVLLLTDGRWAYIYGGCDSTGWGCQEWGGAVASQSLDALIASGIPQEERARLKLPQPY